MALELIGKIIWFILGACFGASIMYFGGLIIDWKEDKKDERGSL